MASCRWSADIQAAAAGGGGLGPGDDDGAAQGGTAAAVAALAADDAPGGPASVRPTLGVVCAQRRWDLLPVNLIECDHC